MKKKTLRIIALIVALTLMLSVAVLAAENASEYIAATSAWITRDGTTIKVNYYIIGAHTMDQIGVKYIYLYESTDYGWTLVKTFSYTDPLYAADMMTTNSSIMAGYLPYYNGSPDKLYFADCRFYAEKNGGSDTIPQNTPIG